MHARAQELGGIRLTVEAEENVYSSRYSNNGASPMWRYGNTCVVRLGEDPSRRGASGMKGRQRGNRMRRLLYTWTNRVGEKPFQDWLEIDNTFDDGGWLFAGDLHLDAAGPVHLLFGSTSRRWTGRRRASASSA